MNDIIRVSPEQFQAALDELGRQGKAVELALIFPHAGEEKERIAAALLEALGKAEKAGDFVSLNRIAWMEDAPLEARVKAAAGCARLGRVFHALRFLENKEGLTPGMAEELESSLRAAIAYCRRNDKRQITVIADLIEAEYVPPQIRKEAESAFRKIIATYPHPLKKGKINWNSEHIDAVQMARAVELLGRKKLPERLTRMVLELCGREGQLGAIEDFEKRGKISDALATVVKAQKREAMKVWGRKGLLMALAQLIERGGLDEGLMECAREEFSKALERCGRNGDAGIIAAIFESGLVPEGKGAEMEEALNRSIRTCRNKGMQPSGRDAEGQGGRNKMDFMAAYLRNAVSREGIPPSSREAGEKAAGEMEKARDSALGALRVARIYLNCRNPLGSGILLEDETVRMPSRALPSQQGRRERGSNLNVRDSKR